ncbi:MAG: hypothetical protein Q8932_10010 [Bacteroidota bacterium]|nr:hypothetical protein [Bacteroidota bacterium]MDP4246171.1 hypothetical protein [Bacteroidota bacterium]MDP4253978.1 hypothetical protein [Bacteroidota bacterium]MDP4257996.1 hypothetical protein [Bacteroidota bacterium]
MRNKYNSFRLLASLSMLILLIGILVAACKKTGITIPPSQATFLNQSSGVYFVTGPNVVDSIPVGVTSVAKTDRTITFTVTSPTGAGSPAQYTITGGNTVTIPANQAIGYILLKANYSAYNGTGRIDSLVFKFSDDKTATVPSSTFNPTFILQVRGACNEGNVTLSDLGGAYKNTFDDGTGGPYTATVTPGTTTGTTGTIKIGNFYNAGFPDLNFSLDWTDPANRLVTFVPQNTGVDAGSVFGPSYAGQTLWIYPDPAQNGTFSACLSTIQVNYYIVLKPANLTPGPEQTILAR